MPKILVSKKLLVLRLKDLTVEQRAREGGDELKKELKRAPLG